MSTACARSWSRTPPSLSTSSPSGGSGTISRAEGRRGKRFVSIRTKYLVSLIAFIAVVIVVLNTYPMTISRDLVFYSKQESVLPHALQIGVAVETLERMTPEAVGRVMSMVETDSLSRVSIFNLAMDELYSVHNDARGYDERVLFSMAAEALDGGRDVFRASFSGGAFMSYACVPIMSGDTPVGAVGVYEYDEVQGALVLGIRDDMTRISVVLGLTALVVAVILARTLSSGVRRVVTGIRSVREGDYNFHVEVRGHDEFTMLAEEFNILAERMQTTEERRRRFVSDASHELKTPLAAIRLLSDTILENENMDPETLREFVSGIREESERLARTTGQLLDLTKLDRGGTAVRVDVDVVEVAKRVLTTLEPVARKAGVTLEAHFDVNCHVMATEDDLFHIIHNLVDNAIKYNVENGRVTLGVNRVDNDVAITVEDTGIGIPEADLPFIFDRFYRVEKSRDREEGGTGLGLSIVKAMTDKHGGTVSVRRLSPQGTSFTVTFSLA